jgi:D-alanyl-D-alanine carboxypeptidase/D-alanyl-D-alanine-endopeptidase (penicillin-binding protein 4)
VNRTVAVVALLLAAVPASAADPLAKKLEAVMDRPEFKRSHWGVLVVDAKSGEAVYERNADKLFVLASCSKLFSTAAVLAEFGTGFRFETPVYVRGEVQKGVLRGDLILRASGDPSFGSRNTKDEGKLAYTEVDHSYANSGSAVLAADTDPLTAFTELAEQVKAAGITEVAGEVLVDDRLFARTRTSGSGPEVLSPLVVNDNVVDVVITPGAKAGEPAKVTHRPQSVLMSVDAEVSTSEAIAPTGVMLNQVGPGQFTVRGSVPANGKVVVRALPVDEPTGFARGLFIEALRKAGVKVAAAVVRPGTAAQPTAAEYGQLPVAGVFTSAPMGELLKVTLKTSNNLYATALPCLLAAKHGKLTQEDGLKIQRKQLKALGVELDAVSLVSGAGGNGNDLASPRATVQLLQGLRKRDDWATYRGWLPTMGEDGTLSKAVDKDSPAYGKVSAKTGTFVFVDTLNGRPLLKSKTLAGAMTAADGRELLFAVFLSDTPLEPNANADKVGKTLAHLCEIVITDKKE